MQNKSARPSIWQMVGCSLYLIVPILAVWINILYPSERWRNLVKNSREAWHHPFRTMFEIAVIAAGIFLLRLGLERIFQGRATSALPPKR